MSLFPPRRQRPNRKRTPDAAREAAEACPPDDVSGDERADPAATRPVPSAVQSDPAAVTATCGGLAAGGDVTGNAIGAHSQVTTIGAVHFHPPAAEQPVPSPLVVDSLPALASSFQPRTELRARIDAARAGGGPVVLTQLLSGGGGVGKTQLAAAYAAEAVHRGEVDLVVWVPAGEEQRIVSTYARAAVRARVPGADGADPERDARTFLHWLSTTSQRWLVVLDDVTDPRQVRDWWPACHTGTGWVLATTRLQHAHLTGGGRTRVDVDVFSSGESLAYLTERFERDGCRHLLDDRAAALADALGQLPLALGHAAAYMINLDLPCAVYLERFQDRKTTLDQILPPEADAEGYGRAVTATLLLALDAAQAAEPVGLATPVLRLAALLDPAGHPDTLWGAAPTLRYLTDRRAALPACSGAPEPAAGAVTPEEARSALRTLHRFALLTVEAPVAGDASDSRTVRVHALTARAARETTPVDEAAGLAAATADALLEVWPRTDATRPSLAALLRANAEALARHADDHLWPDGSPQLLVRAGISLLDAHQGEAATLHWQRLADECGRRLGDEHPDTLGARGSLAAAHWLAGRTAEAIAMEEELLTEHRRLFGEEAATFTVRGNLAASYRAAGRYGEALLLDEQVVRDRDEHLGFWHPDTLAARSNLASSYAHVGRIDEAVALLEQMLAASFRLRGPEAPETLAIGNNLASFYSRAGRIDKAVELGALVAEEQQRLLGAEAPSTLATRSNLASALAQAGHLGEARSMEEQVVAAAEQTLGRDHPDTLTTRANLAMSYERLGRGPEAMQLLEQVLDDRVRVLGRDHPDTLITRSNIATLHRRMGRHKLAVRCGERVVDDLTRILGADHPDTLTARANLAGAHQDAGRPTRAIALGEPVAAALAQRLGEDHPATVTALANLAASYWSAGRLGEALAIKRRLPPDGSLLP